LILKPFYEAIFLIAVLLIGKAPFAQCPDVLLKTETNCLGTILSVRTTDAIQQIVWYNGNAIVKTNTAIVPSNNGTTVAGGFDAGPLANQLSGNAGIFVDAEGSLYVADSRNSRIQKWPPGATIGITVAGGNGSGASSDQFNWVSDIFVDETGNLYVTDISNNRVQKWAPGSSFGVTVAGGNGQGGNANQFFFPSSLFVDKAGNIFVVDQFNYRVQKWAPGATSGVTVAGGNGYGDAADQLINPNGLWIDGAGNIFIADAGNNRVQKWPPGASSGITVAGGNGYGSAANQLANPLDVFVDQSGNIYITDNNNHRIQKWAPDALEGETVAGGNGIGVGSDQLHLPQSSFIAGNGELFVSDFGNNRVQKLTISTVVDTTYTPQTPGTYATVITTKNGCTISSNTIIIQPVLDLDISIKASELTVCENTQVLFEATALNQGNNPVYKWEKNGIAVGGNAVMYSDSNLKNGDWINCIVLSNEACLSAKTATSIPVRIQVNKNPVVYLDQTNVLCKDEKRVLDPGTYATYLWNDGSTGRTLTVYQMGFYSVRVTDNYGCSGTADVKITSIRPALENFLPADTALCSYNKLLLKPNGKYTEYQWNTGNTTESITINEPGKYWVEVKDSYNCVGRDSIIVAAKKCIQGFYVPTAFTPNQDGKNDQFKVFLFGEVQSFFLSIYNRWGQIVFKSSDPLAGWNGIYSGRLQNSGVYIWQCSFQLVGEKINQAQGTVMLIR
jgi:gliding motility-associated-like protein